MFKDRFDAGQQLLAKLLAFKNNLDAVVLAVPCGGVPVGFPIARGLEIPFDTVLMRTIGYPGNPDYIIGAVSLDNVIVDKRALEFSGQMEEYVKNEISRLRHELRLESQFYHASREPANFQHKTIIVIDDGIATGKNLEAAIDLLKKAQPRKIIVAVPVASKEALARIRKKVDEVICILSPELFMSKSQWYQSFNAVDKDEALELLEAAYAR